MQIHSFGPLKLCEGDWSYALVASRGLSKARRGNSGLPTASIGFRMPPKGKDKLPPYFRRKPGVSFYAFKKAFQGPGKPHGQQCWIKKKTADQSALLYVFVMRLLALC